MQPFNRLQPPIVPAPVGNAVGANRDSANKHLLNAVLFASEDTFYQHMEKAIADGADIAHLEQQGEFLLNLAVERNSITITQHLLARGASLPEVGPDEVDIVMKAASNGNADLIAVLIDLGGMVPDSFDANFMTPLHYAIQTGSLSAVKALIDRGADLELTTLRMNAEKLSNVLSHEPNILSNILRYLVGTPVSPLMLAVATGAHDIVLALLEAGSNPVNGSPSPFDMALHKEEKAIIKAMLPRIPADHLLKPTGVKLMENAIYAKSNIDILHLLVAPIDALENNDEKIFTLRRLLMAAVETGDVQATALLLSCGAAPEPPGEEEQITWHFAVECGNEQLLDILSVCHADHLRTLPSNGTSGLLSQLCFFTHDLKTMASNGLFVSQLKHLIVPLQEIKAASNELSEVQLETETAFLLHNCTDLRPSSQEATEISEKETSDYPDVNWIALLPDEMNRQKEWLSSEASQRMEAFEQSLKEVVSFSYFEKLTKACPEDERFQRFMLNDLIKTHGLPHPLASLIAKAWTQSARVAQTEGEAPEDLPSTNLFVTKLAANLITSSIADQLAVPGSLLSHCFKTIPALLASDQTSLKRFVANPGTLLRKLENRNNLRPVDVPALAKLLCTQLGLDLSLSTRIATAWSNAIAMGANQPWQGSTENQHKLIDKTFARELSSLLRELRPKAGSPSLPIPASDANALLAWCAQYETGQIESNVGPDNTSDQSGGLKRRRDFNDRDDQEPPQQKPRNN